VLAVLGLGNPGDEYRSTRHNVGFKVLETVAGRSGEEFARKRFNSQVAEVQMKGAKVLLCKPQTYMNNSGRAARAVLDFYKLEPAEVLVVCDDFNLELGRMRARRSGSDGGHNGLESVITHLGTRDFPRLRLGIGATRRDTVSYVLGRFRAEEEETISKAIERVADAVCIWAIDGIETCMNRFNADPASEREGGNRAEKAEESS
jgi:peptidyl-tRNA hydrolase, PTH1 family